MPLINILTDIAKDTGQPANTGDRNVRIFEINNAIREIHNGVDLPESLKEEVFDINLPSQQIVLPARVDKVIAMRYADSRLRIDVDHKANRYNYQNSGENELWYLQWRDRGWSALSREINNQSILKFSFPTGLSNGVAFTVTITGRTDKAARAIETLNFGALTNEQQSAENWIAIDSIIKSVATVYDLIVKDADDNVMANLPNSETNSLYRNFQVIDTDSFANPENQSGVEVLYKHKFFPLARDFDNYFGTDRYDKAIYWKYMELRSKTQEDAISYHQKSAQVITDALSDQDREVKRKINFSPCTYFNMPYYGWGRDGYDYNPR